jgi:hypothetical protein
MRKKLNVLLTLVAFCVVLVDANLVAAQDMDGDGKVDLVSFSAGTFIVDYSANGLSTPDQVDARYSLAGHIGFAADMDGDLKADLVSISYQTNASPPPHYGTIHIDYASNGFSTCCFPNGDRSYIAAIVYEDRVTTGDFDGDGKQDLAILAFDGVVRIDYAADGFGTGSGFGTGVNYNWDVWYPGYASTGSLVPGDFDGDGRDDISVWNYNSTWAVDYSANGFGQIDRTFTGGSPSGTRHLPYAIDYDLDGRSDLAFHAVDEGYVYIDYSSANGVGGGLDLFPRYFPYSMRVFPGDVDGDGRTDFIFFNDGYNCSPNCGQRKVDYTWNGLGSFDNWNNKGAFLSRLGNNGRFAHRYFVRQMYLDALNRGPDRPGWDGWTNLIAQCGHDLGCTNIRRINVARGILESTEFHNIHPMPYSPGTPEYNAEYVYQLYRVLLRREPDGAYYAWLDIINNSGDYDGLVGGFINSTEYMARDQGAPF